MQNFFHHVRYLLIASLLVLPLQSQAQEAAILGSWVINEELSEITDDKVELALQASGVRTSKGRFSNDDEFYRGGPVEQELYDFMSYEKTLDISRSEAQYTFVYGTLTRPVYLDNRGRRVSLSGNSEVEDFSFANWNNNTLVVEARPRDGGFTEERYQLSEDGMQLRAELYIHPSGFREAIELTRIYDRVSEQVD